MNDSNIPGSSCGDLFDNLKKYTITTSRGEKFHAIGAQLVYKNGSHHVYDSKMQPVIVFPGDSVVTIERALMHLRDGAYTAEKLISAVYEEISKPIENERYYPERTRVSISRELATEIHKFYQIK